MCGLQGGLGELQECQNTGSPELDEQKCGGEGLIMMHGFLRSEINFVLLFYFLRQGLIIIIIGWSTDQLAHYVSLAAL